MGLHHNSACVRESKMPGIFPYVLRPAVTVNVCVFVCVCVEGEGFVSEIPIIPSMYVSYVSRSVLTRMLYVCLC